MYKILENTKIKLDDFTIIIHYAIKILNKYKSVDNDSKLSDLKVTPSIENYKICDSLLNEIGIENLRGQNEELDRHINNLYIILQGRLSKELNTSSKSSEELLKNFKD